MAKHWNQSASTGVGRAKENYALFRLSAIAAQRRVSVPLCAHTRTSDFGGPSDGGHTGLQNFRW